ncbi:MAG: hypothetical protein DHS20C15_27220 [Planctomycetota bacterium]|nr:MAG: hypothetical protein DHS20C15_27220 [Planctomycetota bacterium]
MSPPSTHWVRDPKAIECLSSPTRQRILDRLEALGPSSVAELSASLQLPADGLYYHMRLLTRRGLIVERERRPTNGPPETLFELVAKRWHIHYEPNNKRNAEAVRKLTGSLLRQASRDFEQGLTHPNTTTDGPRRNLWSLRLEAKLNGEEVRELNGHLRAIVELLRRPRANTEGQLCALSWVLAPLTDKTG